MTAADDDAFWLTEADPAVDICDPSLTVDACLDVILPELEAHVSLDVPCPVVEIGCGVGRLTNPLHERRESWVFGVDINQQFIDQARADAPPIGSPGYILADGLDHFHDQEVTAVYSMAVFQHLDNERKRAYIEQVGRVLRPGGVFVFQYVEGTHSSRCMHDALIGDVRAWCEAAGLTVQRVQHDLLMPRWTWVTATREATA